MPLARGKKAQIDVPGTKLPENMSRGTLLKMTHRTVMSKHEVDCTELTLAEATRGLVGIAGVSFFYACCLECGSGLHSSPADQSKSKASIFGVSADT